MLLTACLIVKNEAESLPRCLQSLRGVADEIVLVDTGSSDQTLQIAAQFGAKIFALAWPRHFGQTRNFALAQAQADWIFSIDADEWLTPAAGLALKAHLRNAAPAIYALRWQQHPALAWSQKAVLFPNRRGVAYLGRVHELPWDASGQLAFALLPEMTLSHAPRFSPTDPRKLAMYRALLRQDLKHPDLLERFHALRHWAQSELMLHSDRAAEEALLQAWALVPQLPLACRLWGASVLDSLLFLACEARDEAAYTHWRQIYALHYPESDKLRQLPENWNAIQ
jgi:glycosyltransferase involved in cell wall biosynthesis